MSAPERVSYVHIICNCGHDQHEGRCGVDMGTTTGPCQCPVRWQPPKITVAFYCVKCAELEAAIARLTGALEEIEYHHIELNARKGRNEVRSTTLRMIRAALAEGREKEGKSAK